MSAHEGSAAQLGWQEKVNAQATSGPASPKDEPDPLNDELQAMRSVARTLEKLDEPARLRVLAWCTGRYLSGPMTLQMVPEPWRR